MHFTGQERDSETGNDYFGARYYSSSMGRFLSPDPSGGHFMNPQSLNRYAYVHNNPLSMIDPTGEDCVYTDQLNDDGTVTVELGDCSQPAGNYVNGTIDTNSLQILQGDNGQYSLNFGFTSYDTGDYTLSGFGLPGYSSLSGGFGFGSSQYAAQLFSQAGQTAQIGLNYSMALTAPNFLAMAGISGGGGAAARPLADLWAATSADIGALAARLGSTTLGVFEATRFIMQNPDYWNQATDFISSLFGKDFGPVPATWGGIVGAQLGTAKDLTDYTLEQVTEGVPHRD